MNVCVCMSVCVCVCSCLWPNLVLLLEGDPFGWCVCRAQPVCGAVAPQEGAAGQVLVDGVGGHAGDVRRGVTLDVERDQAVRHQVVHRLKPLLTHKVLPVIKQSVVQSLITKSDQRQRKEDRAGQDRRRQEV